VEVIKPNELNQKIAKIEKPVAVSINNTLSVRLASKPGGFLRIHIECVADCLSVHVASPAAGSIVNAPFAAVSGMVLSGADQVGVVVNGIPAHVYQNRFVVNRLPLELGSNTLVVAATNPCGARVEETLSIHADQMQELPVQLIPHPTSGVDPLAVEFDSLTHIAQPIATYRWDFDGDGAVDLEDGYLSKVAHLYTQPGLYTAQLTVEDREGGRYSGQATIVVIPLAELDTLLTRQWGEMKAELSQKDIEGAMKYFAEGSSKEMFRQNFTLMRDLLPRIVSDMGPMTFDRVDGDGDVAFYTMQAVQGGRTITAPIHFEKDHDGLWRIRFF
jgi:hypothetical protein